MKKLVFEVGCGAQSWHVVARISMNSYNYHNQCSKGKLATTETNQDNLTLDGMQRTWPDDREKRARPDRLTSLFHSAVPVLKHLNWRITNTQRGFAETVLPINVASTNQHITHQAALMLIAADYTGGIALGTLFNQVPIVGIHPQSTDYGAYLWGAKADIKWIRPSHEDLVCTARIPLEQHENIVKRFFRGARVLETVSIDMRNNGVLVAEAHFTYWVQDTFALRKNAFDEQRIHVLYDHRLKTSARLIAGLRALEQDKPSAGRLFDDPSATIIAGTHGKILAQRFSMVAPQIQPMVASRTRHLDEAIVGFHQGKAVQIVNIGVGLDSRVLRMNLPAGSIAFELDLPVMLRRRDELLVSIQHPIKTLRVPVPIDLRQNNPGSALAQISSFNPSMPTFVVWEGGSMYFDAADVTRILSSMNSILSCYESRLWMDYVLPSVIDGTSGMPVVDDFMQAMCCLGEPFINGFVDIRTHLASCGLVVEQDVPSRHYLTTTDPVFDLYRFCLARRMKPGER